MADIPVQNPTTGGYSTVPFNPTTGKPATFPGPSLYAVGLALLTLWFAMDFLPYGYTVGIIIIIGALLASKDVVKAFTGALTFIQTGHT